jgi:hypothetical protein
MLKSVRRAVTMPFNEFKKHVATADLQCMDYFVKYDGFHLVAINDPYGGVAYFTKWGTPLATGTAHPLSARHPNSGRILRAINTHLLGLPLDDQVNPMNIERSDVKGTARQVNFEFIVMRKDLIVLGDEEWDEGKAESLQCLFHGQCINTDGTLNTVDFEYRVKIFDVVFKESYIPMFARVEAALYSYGPDMTATQIHSYSDLARFLNGREGVVAHTAGSSFKIKVPCPIRARIVGVQSTIAGFAGWDRMLVCVENEQANCLDAICEINLTEILTDHTRPSKGKVYANPKCVKYCPKAGTVVYQLANGAQSTSAIAPTLNALYGLIGKATLLPPITSTTTEAKIMMHEDALLPSVVKCGRNRTFGLAGYEYLTQPIDIIMGVNDIWSIAHNQLHLQAPSVLCLPKAGFGYLEFVSMPFTKESTLRIAANQRLCRDRMEYYLLVGLTDGPFQDMVKMEPKLFCA